MKITNIKRTIALLLTACIMAASLTACGDSEETDTNGNTVISPGVIDTEANTYTNNFLEFKGEFPEGWLISTPEKVAELNGVTDGEMTAQLMADTMSDSDSGICYDFWAQSDDELDFVQIFYMVTDSLVYSDQESFAENMSEVVTENLEAEGITECAAAVMEVEFAGQTYYAVKYSSYANEIKYYGEQIYIINYDNTAIINISTIQNDHVDEVIAKFSALQ